MADEIITVTTEKYDRPKVETEIKIATQTDIIGGDRRSEDFRPMPKKDKLTGFYLFGIVNVEGFFSFEHYKKYFIEKKLPYSLLIVSEDEGHKC